MKRIVLNLAGCQQLHALHRILKRNFEFPIDYGEDWDVLRDCLRHYTAAPLRVEICGLTLVAEELDEAMQILFKIFDEAHQECPNMEFVLVS